MTDRTPSAPCKDVQFENLAFCWDLFEKVGYNDEILEKHLDIVQGPVLLVGGGQGLLSRRLLDHGFEVRTVEALRAMADRALQRRGVPTEVRDFFTLTSERPYPTVIVSTGVVRADTASELERFAETAQCVVAPGGRLLLGANEEDLFDEVALDIGLDKPDTILALWNRMKDGTSFADAVFELRPAAMSSYRRVLWREHLERTGVGLRMIARRYREHQPDGNVDNFISQTMRYVPFSMTPADHEQIVQQLEAAGFQLIEIRREGVFLMVFQKPPEMTKILPDTKLMFYSEHEMRSTEQDRDGQKALVLQQGEIELEFDDPHFFPFAKSLAEQKGVFSAESIYERCKAECTWDEVAENLQSLVEAWVLAVCE